MTLSRSTICKYIHRIGEQSCKQSVSKESTKLREEPDRIIISNNLKGLKEKNLYYYLHLGFHISTPEIGMLFGKGLHHCPLVKVCVLKV